MLQRVAVNKLRVDRFAAPRLALELLGKDFGKQDADDEPEDCEREDKR